MKKIILSTLSLVLIASVWIACQKNSSNIAADPQQDLGLKTADIGIWHNRALELYAQQHQSGLKINSTSATVKPGFNEVREVVISSLVKDNPDIFNEKNIRQSLKKLDDSKDADAIQSWNKIEGTNKLSTIISKLKESGEISNKLVSALEGIDTQTKKGVDSKTILASVNLLKTASFDTKDRKYADVFVAVYNSSYSYWTSDSKSTTSLRVNNMPVGGNGCNQIIITADTAGALYGMITGPITSVIEAGVFSLLASINPPCEPAN